MINFRFLENPERRIRKEGIYIEENNVFFPVREEEVQKAEGLLGFEFPSQLKEFYKKIGYGHLTTPHNPPEGYSFCNSNEILPPLVAANFSKGILRWDGQDNWMSESTYELLEPGDLPFFEIGDSSSFMVMKPHSDNPNAVWYMGVEKIEDSFEKFIWQLYYEDPSYYAKDW